MVRFANGKRCGVADDSTTAGDRQAPPIATTLLRRVLDGSRYLLAIGVVSALAGAIALLVYAGIATVTIVWDAYRDAAFDMKGATDLAVAFLKLIDVILVGTVLYIIALGLVELFVDPELPTPGWLTIRTLDDLKDKVIGTVIVLIGVSFTGQFVESRGDDAILRLGLAVAAVVLALGVVQFLGAKRGK